MDTDTYTCARCGGTFETTWSDAEANREAEQNFGVIEASHRAVVCDDCYRAMVAILPPTDWLRQLTSGGSRE